ncbi:hypothetical protein A2962_01315 [Candidatus Woesebacteria bacterium RIFCSPLOWO2_01_FULL_39_61]|uniref:Uncharacterized protein n=1 Tax=Candidatus Woesebacteria bacterium RIFCSPHIGHO2_02_FULL_39_13 TaxID=1802505 RepID=A0A1F7Z4W2_9BACT|nr:MAG: hypothetical protein A2692_01555 [Candidatus Woesebacteria bacterium RIFCSPHIGHO2_01_FULL_39_95]OGM34491.1 MAG: hypothetical protein A3D01_03010 [Candidatus Woesebacteria bacterium RIFCSPHIGHO2_02_FULL_39_13]OGM38756.1 MAG: hypothetical protein A3E13_00900 [Candidatus Woesebacteria bacterium RIFCSPHIGHO2_12_FULL_40_20]OGM65762.1 MAG: hypothetical protein A2962_01315 [Candidatus Woesebacteria bacterium RIFCSPLOWO2_01_FULL_39_61]OGM71511.1 MAG: hypothetical protein A3H19_00130 [Candidatus
MKNQSGGVDVGSEKLYTQDEVNNLRKDWKESHSSQAREIEKETQTADKQKRLNNRKVAKLVKKSNRILVSISSHKLPFDLFPDTINIEEGRITIITRQLLSSEVHSVDIKDISNIFINTSFFFSQLIIISKTFEENEIRIRNLRTKEAIFVRRIIEGLRIFENKQIDTSGYTKGKLVAKLKELSTTEIVT